MQPPVSWSSQSTEGRPDAPDETRATKGDTELRGGEKGLLEYTEHVPTSGPLYAFLPLLWALLPPSFIQKYPWSISRKYPSSCWERGKLGYSHECHAID